MNSSTEIHRQNQTAKCRTCQETKSWSEFEICKSRRPFGLSSNCSLCEKDRKRAVAAKWRAKNKGVKDSYRASNLKKFGLSVEEYESMSESQGHRCRICNEPETDVHHSTGSSQRLAVDHCHNTGQVRGLLCAKCNKGLGLFNDNQQLLLSAVKYLNNDHQDPRG